MLMLLQCHTVSAGSHDLQRLQARGPDLSSVPGETETRGQAVLRRAAAGQGAHPLPVQLRGLPGGADQGEAGAARGCLSVPGGRLHTSGLQGQAGLQEAAGAPGGLQVQAHHLPRHLLQRQGLSTPPDAPSLQRAQHETGVPRYQSHVSTHSPHNTPGTQRCRQHLSPLPLRATLIHSKCPSQVKSDKNYSQVM